MPAQFWESALNSPAPTVAGTALASSATLTDISQAPQLVLPANYMYPGFRFRCTAFGTFSNTGTPTLLLGFYYGGVAGIAMAAIGATTTVSTGGVNWPWHALITGVCRSTGTSGTIIAQGLFQNPGSLTTFNQVPMPATALTTVTVDTTTAKAITVGAQWGTSSASNTITCHDFIFEALN